MLQMLKRGAVYCFLILLLVVAFFACLIDSAKRSFSKSIREHRFGIINIAGYIFRAVGAVILFFFDAYDRCVDLIYPERRPVLTCKNCGYKTKCPRCMKAHRCGGYYPAQCGDQMKKEDYAN